MKPPATDPASIAAPATDWPLANTDSRWPSNLVKVRASTSQASTAPEKKVKPSPMRAEATAHPQNGAMVRHMNRYRSVDANSVTAPRR